MANCEICGETLVHFKNPDRDICPTPDRHAVSRLHGRSVGGRKGTGTSDRRKRVEDLKKDKDKDKDKDK